MEINQKRQETEYSNAKNLLRPKTEPLGNFAKQDSHSKLVNRIPANSHCRNLSKEIDCKPNMKE